MKERGKRWLDVLAVLLLSLIILALSLQYIDIPISGWLNQQNMLYRSLMIFLVSACLWEFINKTGGIRVCDLNPTSYFKYPSIWITSILLAILYFMVAIFLVKNEITLQQLPSVLLNVLVFILAGTIVGLCHSISQPSKPEGNEFGSGDVERDGVFDNPEKILEWANAEIPIKADEDDYFKHRYIADKIRRILSEEINKNIGIVGGYGYGKSSIINLLMSEKKKDEIFCKIEGWGFKENTAIEHILQLVIEELKLHFDCLSIANLPKQYHEAMNNSGNNMLNVLGCFFRGTRDPEKILGKIDSILKCVDKRLFIVLEDIDRNINDATFYNEIASFLNVTKKVERISFIIAIGPKHNLDEILTKLCEHNEYIQRIDKKEIVSIYEVLINHWHSLYPDDVPIRDCEKVKNFIGFHKNKHEEHTFRLIGRDRPIDYVSQLLDTPRKLKTTIREIGSLWRYLHGEIHFESFFFAMVLKTAAPEAYAFINDEIRNIRILSYKHSDAKSDAESGIKALVSKWKQITEKVLWDVESARKIVCVLFPVFRQGQLDDDISFLVDEKTLQGFMNDSLVDYWKKMNVGTLLPAEIGDQIVLKAIDGWRIDHCQKTYIHNGASQTLSNAIFEVDGLDEKFENFGVLLEAKEIYDLSSVLFDKSLKKDKNNACGDLCPGFFNLWRLAHEKDEYSEHEKWLINEIEKALDVSLYFSNDLCHYWRHKRSYDVSAKTPTPKLKKRVVDIFRNKFEDNPKSLCEILSQSNPWGLYRMVRLDKGGNSEEWEWLGDVLLEASKINQKLLASYIACLISDTEIVFSSKSGSVYKNKLNVDTLEAFFGEKTSDVMELLNKEFEYPELADDYEYAQTKSVIQNAQEEARIWIDSKGNSKAID